MNPHTKRKIRRVIAPFRKIGLKNRNFSIIANNCWGGFVYDIYGLQYLSPTIGAYFFPEDYLKFLSRLEYYLSIEAKVLDFEKSKHKQELLKGNNRFIGVIDDIEVVFVHYNSAEEAGERVNRRRTRVNFDNLLVKFNDQNGFKEEDLEQFDKLDYPHKLFFTADKKSMKKDYCVFLKKFEKQGYVVDDIKSSSRAVNFKKLLNRLK